MRRDKLILLKWRSSSNLGAVNGGDWLENGYANTTIVNVLGMMSRVQKPITSSCTTFAINSFVQYVHQWSFS